MDKSNIPDIYFKIKEQEGFEFSVVAGGWIRDLYMDGQPTDLDVFIPCKNQADFKKKVLNLDIEDLEINEFLDAHAYDISSEFVGKFDAKYNGIDIDLCGYIYTRPHPFSFTNDLVSTFNFDIDKCWYDGVIFDRMDVARSDAQSRVATLSKLGMNPYDLVRSVKKFERLQEKYPDLMFSHKLEIKERNFWEMAY